MPLSPELLQQVLELPPADREQLHHLIEESLDNKTPDPSVEGAWAHEAVSRLEAYERGEIEAEDWHVVMNRLRSKFERDGVS